MTITEYSRILDTTSLNFEGNNITKSCKNLLEGLLEKNVNKRFSYDHAINHPWIILIRDKIEDITNKFQNDAEKMISQLNNTIIKDEFFDNKNYVEIDIEKEVLEYKINNIAKKNIKDKKNSKHSKKVKLNDKDYAENIENNLTPYYKIVEGKELIHKKRERE
jgi:serine/threonine protein kinase